MSAPLALPPARAVSVPFDAPVVEARFIRRYKRFFVDVDIDGVVHTAHTANTGAMTGLLVPGARALLTRSDNPKRKLALELEALAVAGDDAAQRGFVACNTIRSNRVAEAFVRGGAVPVFADVDDIERERPLGASRVDLFVTHRDGRTRFIEVKSVTLRQGDAALFPDAVSERATKHVEELHRAALAGQPVGLLFLVQRSDCAVVRAARAVDVAYADALARAAAAGVVVAAVAVRVDAAGIHSAGTLRVET